MSTGLWNRHIQWGTDSGTQDCRMEHGDYNKENLGSYLVQKGSDQRDKHTHAMFFSRDKHTHQPSIPSLPLSV